MRSSASRWRCATSRRRPTISNACWRRAPPHKPPPEVFQPGPAGDAARKEYGDWYTELMRHEWFMNGYPPRLSLRRLADRLAGRHAGAAARRPDLHPDRAAGRARAACVDCRTGVRRSICSAGASCCCGSARMRRAASSIVDGRGGCRRAACVIALDVPEVTAALCSAGWCSCVPTAMWPGAPMRSRRMRARSSIVVRGARGCASLEAERCHSV